MAALRSLCVKGVHLTSQAHSPRVPFVLGGLCSWAGCFAAAVRWEPGPARGQGRTPAGRMGGLNPSRGAAGSCSSGVGGAWRHVGASVFACTGAQAQPAAAAGILGVLPAFAANPCTAEPADREERRELPPPPCRGVEGRGGSGRSCKHGSEQRRRKPLRRARRA